MRFMDKWLLSLALIIMMTSHAFARPFVKVALNNNPKVSAAWENTVLGNKADAGNTPWIRIKGAGFNNGATRVTAEFAGKIIAESAVDISSGIFETTVFLKSPLEHPQEITVKVGDDFTQQVPVNIKRLYGTVRFFDGSPVRFPLVTTLMYRRSSFFISAVGDENGNYEIFLPEKTSSIAIFDKDYSKSNLECWIYEADLKEDLRLDARLDKIEVFRLHAWPGEMKLYIHFIPMSITRVNETKRKGAKDEISIASTPEVWPDLKKEDIRVFIGEKQTPITMFKKVPDITRLKDTDVPRPGYILSVNAGFQGKVVRVEIHTTAMERGKTIHERGEGFFLGFLNE